MLLRETKGYLNKWWKHVCSQKKRPHSVKMSNFLKFEKHIQWNNLSQNFDFDFFCEYWQGILTLYENTKKSKIAQITLKKQQSLKTSTT